MRTSFGLNSEYMETVYETFFYMKYYGGWSFIEAYNLPVALRDWFAKKLTSHMEKEAEQVRQQTSKYK